MYVPTFWNMDERKLHFLYCVGVSTPVFVRRHAYVQAMASVTLSFQEIYDNTVKSVCVFPLSPMTALVKQMDL